MSRIFISKEKAKIRWMIPNIFYTKGKRIKKIEKILNM